MLPVLLLATVIGSSVGGPFGREFQEPDCSQREDGVVWLGGCASFGFCIGGQYRQFDCTNGTVVDTDTLECTDPALAPFPCNQPAMNCSAHVLRPGYRMPLQRNDLTRGYPPCRVYFTCVYGRFLAFQWCPEGTVYDEFNQRCSHPEKVNFPCGTNTPNPAIASGLQDTQTQDEDAVAIVGDGVEDGGPNARDLFGAGQYQSLYGQRQNRNSQFDQRNQYGQRQNQNPW